MKNKKPISPLINLSIIFFSLLARNSLGLVDQYFQDCVPETCGDGQNIRFPFHIQNQHKPFCGYPGFDLSCNNNLQPTLKISNNTYIVHQIFYQTQTLRLSNAAFSNSNISCTPSIRNISLPNDQFELVPHQTDLFLLYDCNSSLLESPLQFYTDCHGEKNKTGSVLALPKQDPRLSDVKKKCKTGVVTPVEAFYGGENGGIGKVLRNGFVLKWRASNCSICEESGGKCGFNSTTYQFRCFCRDRPHAWRCTNNPGTYRLKVMLALGIGGAVLIISTCFFVFIRRHYKEKHASHQNVEAFLRNYSSLAIRRYSYSNIKRMTNSFKHKLGQGGYGGVYRGELKDGSLVAVKVLKESKGNGEEFINEVASISRTSHVNIVTLMGFCFEGSKRALIYEFMPNGSLEKFIYKENPSNTNHQLGWETLYKVAIGIARGLEYLHQGCNTRILHFDIKPHNILLDEEFCPKISDFGLAKICPRKESIISMVGARGTAGYIAPEVFCRSFGGVSHKSDVYSYGMMVLEMVGGRKNVDAGVDHTSEIYFFTLDLQAS